MTTAREFCTRDVVTVSRRDTIVEAARRMRAASVGDVIVVEEKSGRTIPVGILTDRDLALRVIVDAPECGLSLLVDDVTIPELVTADDSDDLTDVIRTMRTFGIRRIPVIDDAGALEGIIVFDEVLEYLADELSDLVALLRRGLNRERDKTRPSKQPAGQTAARP